MKQIATTSLLLLLSLSTAALALAPVASISERTAPATYRVKTEGTTVLVDAYLASLRLDGDYLPLHVAIGVGGRGERLLVNRESFTVVDQQGTVYPLATFEEIRKDYGRTSFDRSLLRAHPMVVGNIFSTSTMLPALFFPSSSAQALRRDSVDIGKYTWFHDVLYFPRPLFAPEDLLTLRVEGAQDGTVIEVSFRVPSR